MNENGQNAAGYEIVDWRIAVQREHLARLLNGLVADSRVGTLCQLYNLGQNVAVERGLDGLGSSFRLVSTNALN